MGPPELSVSREVAAGYVGNLLFRILERSSSADPDEKWRARTRRRWACLTMDLRRYVREMAAADELATGTSQSIGPQPPLDVPPRKLDAVLAPMREKLRERVEVRLASYDSANTFPRPQDMYYECRDGYEAHLRGEALQEVHAEIEKHGSAASSGGQLWKIVGGTHACRQARFPMRGNDSGGIIVRSGREMTSRREDARLSSGAWVQQLDLVEDRLHYKLVSGAGPAEGWVTTNIKAGGAERHLAIRAKEGAVEGCQASTAKPPVMLGLMAAHIATRERLDRFKHTLRSIKKQEFQANEVDFTFTVSWSAATPELQIMVQRVVDAFVAEPGPAMLAVPQAERRSQFQHLREALLAADSALRQRTVCPQRAPSEEGQGGDEGSAGLGEGEEEGSSIWVVFGDDDDIWHHRRVAEYARAIRSHAMIEGVGVFATTARAYSKHDVKVTDRDMPTTEEEVDKFLRGGRGARMNDEEPCVVWRRERRRSGKDAYMLAVPVDIGLEYFDLCPRLRFVHEFFARTSSELLEHRYCDLRFNEFLCTYPRMGNELGLEVSFFEPRSCWMLFYSTPCPDEKQWEKSVEDFHDDAGPGNPSPSSPLAIDVNNGHMSSSLSVEPAETELAKRMCDEFKEYELGITPSRLARYWATFRNSLEFYLVRKHQGKIDQRIFDLYVFMAVNASFFKFADKLGAMPNRPRAETAERMMYYVGQGFGKAVAFSFGVSVLWVKPQIFIGRDFFFSAYGYAVPLLGAKHLK